MPTAQPRITSNLTQTTPTYTSGVEVLSGATLQVSLSDPAQVVHLQGLIIVTGAAGTTSCIPRIRRTGLTGTQVGGAPTISMTASATCVIVNMADDNPGDVASLVYVLTGLCAGANGTGVLAYLQAIVE